MEICISRACVVAQNDTQPNCPMHYWFAWIMHLTIWIFCRLLEQGKKIGHDYSYFLIWDKCDCSAITNFDWRLRTSKTWSYQITKVPKIDKIFENGSFSVSLGTTFEGNSMSMGSKPLDINISGANKGSSCNLLSQITVGQDLRFTRRNHFLQILNIKVLYECGISNFGIRGHILHLHN